MQIESLVLVTLIKIQRREVRNSEVILNYYSKEKGNLWLPHRCHVWKQGLWENIGTSFLENILKIWEKHGVEMEDFHLYAIVKKQSF